MRQDFSGVTAERLAELFPILLEEHSSAWGEGYAREAAALQDLFGKGNVVRTSHIGSTAVPGLLAKPTIDILVEIRPGVDVAALTEKMLDAGYVVNIPAQDIVLFLKGYTPRGFEGQAFHIHVRDSGDWGELYFRDYLAQHPDVAAAYGGLKAELQKRYANDRDAYTDAKGEFICRYTEKARRKFAGRYRPAV